MSRNIYVTQFLSQMSEHAIKTSLQFQNYKKKTQFFPIWQLIPFYQGTEKSTDCSWKSLEGRLFNILYFIINLPLPPWAWVTDSGVGRGVSYSSGLQLSSLLHDRINPCKSLCWTCIPSRQHHTTLPRHSTYFPYCTEVLLDATEMCLKKDIAMRTAYERANKASFVFKLKNQRPISVGFISSNAKHCFVQLCSETCSLEQLFRRESWNSDTVWWKISGTTLARVTTAWWNREGQGNVSQRQHSHLPSVSPSYKVWHGANCLEQLIKGACVSLPGGEEKRWFQVPVKKETNRSCA